MSGSVSEVILIGNVRRLLDDHEHNDLPRRAVA